MLFEKEKKQFNQNHTIIENNLVSVAITANAIMANSHESVLMGRGCNMDG